MMVTKAEPFAIRFLNDAGTLAEQLGAQFVIGVDTGLLHLAAALRVPLLAIFAGSRPELTGPVGQGPIEVVGDKDMPASVEDVTAAIERIVR